MEEYRHVVFVVCGVETSNIDEGVALAIAESLGVQRGSPVVVEPYRAVVASVFDPPRLCRNSVHVREESDEN